MIKSPVTRMTAIEAINSGVVSLGFSGVSGGAFSGEAFTAFLVVGKFVFPRNYVPSRAGRFDRPLSYFRL
jgi:hypothetical protein